MDNVSYEELPQRVKRSRIRDAPTTEAVATELLGTVQSTIVVEETNAPLNGNEEEVERVQDSVEPAVDLPEYRSAAVEGYNFEYLDHTADVQLHSWGATLEEAIANVGLAMFNYMTPIAGIGLNDELNRQFHVEGHDMESLLFNFLDELLFVFSTEFFVCRELSIITLDRENWKIVASGNGDTFDRNKHESGTEIKAITYSAMQIIERPDDAEVFVIVDI